MAESSEPLTPRQVQSIQRLVGLLCQVGHGELVIRIKNGVPRFTAITLEEELSTERGSGIARMITIV